ncbi:MAG: DUF87 domain-containing protein [Gemmataceae bacterium]
MPRNVGIFGTVGSGKSNSVQVLVEEASQRGWAVIMLDLESKYTAMDALHAGALRPAGAVRPQPRPDRLFVYHPLGLRWRLPEQQSFHAALADFDSSITAELLRPAWESQRPARLHRPLSASSTPPSARTSDVERHKELLDSSPSTRMPFTVQPAEPRLQERSPRSSESLDYIGLTNKLLLLIHSRALTSPTPRAWTLWRCSTRPGQRHRRQRPPTT